MPAALSLKRIGVTGFEPATFDTEVTGDEEGCESDQSGDAHIDAHASRHLKELKAIWVRIPPGIKDAIMLLARSSGGKAEK